MKTIAILAIASAAAAPAFAGGPVITAPEPVIVAPVVVYVPNFDWTGGYIGAHLGYAHGKAETNAFTGSGNGVIGGINGGYRYDFGQFVLGGELSFTDSNVDYYNVGKLRNTTDLKLIAGADLGKTLIYGTVGPSYGSATVLGNKRHDTGYVVGIGADYALNEHVTVGGELLYRDFNDFDKTGQDLSGTSLEAKVGYKF